MCIVTKVQRNFEDSKENFTAPACLVNQQDSSPRGPIKIIFLKFDFDFRRS